jgi:nucleoside 2-deoxyribosyltransferase
VKIYVATKWEEIPRAREVMGLLMREGHTITYDWTYCEQLSREQAIADKQGVMDADVLVFIAEKHLAYNGALAEFGMALARGIPVYVLGPGIDSNIFMQLPEVRRGLPSV